MTVDIDVFFLGGAITLLVFVCGFLLGLWLRDIIT